MKKYSIKYGTLDYMCYNKFNNMEKGVYWMT